MSDTGVPLVSVIIPTYNRLHTLPTAIGSVLNQTYSNLELIIMDDGSDDGTEEYVKGIVDSRVRYEKSERNMGPSAARNRGAKLAEGEYLAFQDSDDEWFPDKLEKQMRLMLGDRDLSLVYCEFGAYSNGELLVYIPSREIPYKEKCGDIFPFLLLYPLVSTQTIVVKKQEFIEAQGFVESLKSYEDYEFTLRFAQEHRFGFMAEPLVKVNSSQGSVNKRFDERIRSQFYMVREMLEPLRVQGLLWKKMKIILEEAEEILCHDVFVEELRFLSQESFTDEERQYAEYYIKLIEQDKEISALKTEFQKSLPSLKKKVLNIYMDIYGNKTGWVESQKEEMRQIAAAAYDCKVLFENADEMEALLAKIRKDLDNDQLQWAEQLFLLTDIIKLLEMQEKG